MKAERDKINVEAWYNGMYAARAISAVFGKNSAYPSEPLDMSESVEPTAASESERFSVMADIFNHMHTSLTDASKS